MNNEFKNSSNEKIGLDYPLVCNLCYSEMEQTTKAQWVCPKCGSHAYMENPNDPESIYYEFADTEQYNDDYENDIPEGCRACGSDQYPICMEGCPLMDE